MTKGVENHIFISYSHKDVKWLKKLQTHLEPLRRKYLISAWDDTKIKPGSEWKQEIGYALSAAKIAILLVSPDFLASNFINQHELPALLKAASKEGVRIFWIAIRDSLYSQTDIGRYQAVNNPSKPLAGLKPSEQDKELVEICSKLTAAIIAPKSHRKKKPLAEVSNSPIVPKTTKYRRGTVVEQIPASPYRGLFSFREQDAEFFFGREAITRNLVEAVQTKPLVAVLGPSGSGKSSVVFAGLIPQLKMKGFRHIAICRPLDNPFYNLASALIPLLEDQISETKRLIESEVLSAALRSGEVNLDKVVGRIINRNNDASTLLLVVDQFEELYTLCKSRDEQKNFLDALLTTVHTKSYSRKSGLSIVLTLRADFLGQALSYPSFVDALQNSDIKLGPLSPNQLRAAIEKPARTLGVTIESGLTERIINTVSKSPGSLPLLEFALSLLWERQKGAKLTHAAYDLIGGVEMALANHAEQVYRKFDRNEKIRAQKVFIQLVNPGEGTEDTRRRAARDELGEVNWQLVSRLADEDARLVVCGRNEADDTETVEIVHEALITGWERLRDWMRLDREFRLWQERLRAMLRQWLATHRDSGALLRGTLLTDAEKWIALRPAEIGLDEQEFIKASQENKQIEEGHAAVIAQAQAALEAANRTKDEFLAALSHELRTPLTAILGWTNLLRSGSPDKKTFNHGLEVIERNARLQGNIIDDLLDVSRIVAGKLSIDVRMINIVSLITEVVDSARPLATSKEIALELVIEPNPLPVAGDHTRLYQSISSILGNAIKFTPAGGRVQVQLICCESHVEIRVTDNGIGISNNYLPFIFERFSQANMSTTRLYGGLGLGLSIARHLIELHGGIIRAESAGEGLGSTFTISLPLLPSPS